MGTYMSILGKIGLPWTSSISTDEIFDNFFDHNICTFEQFHNAFLTFFNKFNSSMPGKHFDAPPIEKIWECYNELKEPDKNSEEKKYMVIELMEKYVGVSHTNDNAMLVTGLVAPPAALFLKRVVPDVIFVPSFTILAIIVVKVMQINTVRKIE